MTTHTEIKPRPRCGFCNDGAHYRCPGVIRNGNGSLWQCPCTATSRCGSLRCTECNNRVAGEVSDDGLCHDRDACMAQIERQRERWIEQNPGMVRAMRPASPEPLTKIGVTFATKPSSGTCLCCGGATKGGMFLPGHDARWVSLQVKRYIDGGENRDDVRREMVECGVSDALLEKYDKRVGLL